MDLSKILGDGKPIFAFEQNDSFLAFNVGWGLYMEARGEERTYINERKELADKLSGIGKTIGPLNPSVIEILLEAYHLRDETGYKINDETELKEKTKQFGEELARAQKLSDKQKRNLAERVFELKDAISNHYGWGRGYYAGLVA